jgi:hypothetical protein
MATDSTIHVVLTRQILLNEPQGMVMLTPPPSPSSSDDSRLNLFTRVAKATPRPGLLKRRPEEVYDKPLPSIPHAGKLCYSDCKTIQSQVFIGFPKRPRRKASEGRKHPTLEEQKSLPDGLMKSQINLDMDMLPSVDWVGVSVKVRFHSVLAGALG